MAKTESISLTSGIGRMSYAFLLNPVDSKLAPGKFKYKVDLVYPKADLSPEWIALMAGVRRLGEASFGPDFMQLVREGRGFHSCVKDGDAMPKADPLYKGCYILSTSTQASPNLPGPTIVGPTLQRILSAEDVFSGCWGRAAVTIKCYDHVSKGVAAYLRGVQVVRKDTPLGSGVDPESEFGVIADAGAAANVDPFA